MATVRFSDELRKTILKKADRVFEKRIETAEENYPKEEWGATVYGLLFQTHRAAMDALPMAYFTTSDDISLAGFGNDNDRKIELELGSKLRFPDCGDSEVHGTKEGHNSRYYGMQLNPDDARWADFKPKYDAYCEAVNKLYAEQKKFRNSVQQVIEAYSTLGPALKAWPPLWELVPENKKEKHNQIVERVKAADKAADAVEGLDLNGMTAATTRAKLTQ